MLQSVDFSRWPRLNYFENFDIAHCVQRVAKHYLLPTWNGLAIRDDIFVTKSIAVERMCPMCRSDAAIALTSSATMAAVTVAPNYLHVGLDVKRFFFWLILLSDIPYGQVSTHLKHSIDFHRSESNR